MTMTVCPYFQPLDADIAARYAEAGADAVAALVLPMDEDSVRTQLDAPAAGPGTCRLPLTGPAPSTPGGSSTPRTTAGTFDRALAELAAGAKRTHWMWFVFPQLRGLGYQPDAPTFFGLATSTGPSPTWPIPCWAPAPPGHRHRARRRGGDAEALLGPVDALSCVRHDPVRRGGAGRGPLRQVLDRYFDGVADPRTLDRLGPER